MADAICVVTSQLGFEGLIWGKDVYVFGSPFYAGWGLTYDGTQFIATDSGTDLFFLDPATMKEVWTSPHY